MPMSSSVFSGRERCCSWRWPPRCRRGSASATAQSSSAPGALPASLPATLRALPGRSSAALLDLDAPDGAAGDDPDMIMPAGALIMLPLAGAAYARVATGAWRADTTFTLADADKVGGTGSLQYRPAGTTLALDDLVALMLGEGDNTAANLVLARLGGVAAVNEYAGRLGLRGTTMRRPLFDTAARAAGVENTTTAGDLARLLLLLDRGKSPARPIPRASSGCSATGRGATRRGCSRRCHRERGRHTRPDSGRTSGATRGSCASAAIATRSCCWFRMATGRRWSAGSRTWLPRPTGRSERADHHTTRGARTGVRWRSVALGACRR